MPTTKLTAGRALAQRRAKVLRRVNVTKTLVRQALALVHRCERDVTLLEHFIRTEPKRYNARPGGVGK